MSIRTDLSDTGVVIFKYWILKLLDDLDRDNDIENSSIDVKLFLIILTLGIDHLFVEKPV